MSEGVGSEMGKDKDGWAEAARSERRREEGDGGGGVGWGDAEVSCCRLLVRLLNFALKSCFLIF